MQGTYLAFLPSAAIAGRYSKDSKRRATQIRQFLLDLHATLPHDRRAEGLELILANRNDWQALSSYTYALSFARKMPKAQQQASSRVQIFAPADYPERLIKKFGPLRLLMPSQPSSEARSFLDMCIGYAWAHAVVLALEPKLSAKDAIARSVEIFLTALHEAGLIEIYAQLQEWHGLLARALANNELEPNDIRYPASKMSLGNQLYVYSNVAINFSSPAYIGADSDI